MLKNEKEYLVLKLFKKKGIGRFIILNFAIKFIVMIYIISECLYLKVSEEIVLWFLKYNISQVDNILKYIKISLKIFV